MCEIPLEWPEEEAMSLNINYIIKIHDIRDRIIDFVSSVCNCLAKVNNGICYLKQSIFQRGRRDVYPYQHVFRKKTKWELILLSSAVCGIEFCYSAETAYVSPILLGMGIKVEYMTMIWCLSPVIGFFLTPTMGSMSDSCKSSLGRRRPFILILSAGIFLGLILVPNGKDIGLALGDVGDQYLHNFNMSDLLPNVTNSNEFNLSESDTSPSHPLGITFTVLGVILLDFCCDSCQSPSRSYLLDVTVSEQHSRGLSMFTLMAGFGGFFGYMMGAIEWEGTIFTTLLGDHVRVVFAVVTFLFIIAVIVTVTSFSEIPLGQFVEAQEITQTSTSYQQFQDEDNGIFESSQKLYGTLKDINTECRTERKSGEKLPSHDVSISTQTKRKRDYEMIELASTETGETSEIKHTLSLQQMDVEIVSLPTVKDYFRSILKLPKSLHILCVTNLFSWMSLLCYSLYFTDFVGEAVFLGDPLAHKGSLKYQHYHKGVRFGCWGMALYSLSCCIYSYYMDRLVNRFGAKHVYVCGQMIYSLGMAIMSLCHHQVAVILLSPTAGIMYATLFTMPYLLVAQYHCISKFDEGDENQQIRGMGTDVAIVSSMVFVAQFILSLCMGSIVYAIGSSVATVVAASMLSFCGALCATQVMYLEL